MGQLVSVASRGVLVALALVVLACPAGAQVTLQPGDLIVLDQFAGDSGFGGVFHVDPTTGVQTPIASDGLFDAPSAVAVGPDSQIYVTNCGCGTAGVFRVDPATGTQTPVTSGGFLVFPSGIAVAASGDLYVVDADAFGVDPDPGPGGVIRVNPSNGAQEILTSGGNFLDPAAIAIGPTGDLFVTEIGDGVNTGSSVIRVNPTTGVQTPVASAADFADLWVGITVAPNGDIYVLNASCGCTVVIRVDPGTGDQTPVASDGLFEFPAGIAFGGDLFVADAGFSTASVIRVDPATGDQAYVTTDDQLIAPMALAVVRGFALTVTLAGAGAGTVTSLPAGVACPGDCAETFTGGTPVTLTAPTPGGSVFVGWSGACSGLGPCVLSMVADRAVTATFAPPSFLLSVTLAGAGTGTVASDVAGIACPSDCGEAFVGGTLVTLTATATGGALFAGWSGACTGLGPCVLSMVADRAVTATFERARGIATGPASSAEPRVRRFAATGSPALAEFDAYASFFPGGVFVATGNLDGAGPREILTGAGATGAPHVRAFDGDGTPRNTSFLAYAPGFLGGVRVAACDFDGNGRAEIVTAPGPGDVAQIRVIALDGLENPSADLANFLAYDAAFTGGAFVACGDVDGDGVADVVTGADAGGGPHVRVFSLVGGLHEVVGFFAFPAGFTGGVRVATGDVDGSGRASVVVGAGPGGAPHVRVLKWTGSALAELGSFLAYDALFTGGVFVGAGDVTGVGHADVITGAGAGGGPHVRLFTGAGADTGLGFLAYGPTFVGGVTVTAGP